MNYSEIVIQTDFRKMPKTCAECAYSKKQPDYHISGMVYCYGKGARVIDEHRFLQIKGTRIPGGDYDEKRAEFCPLTVHTMLQKKNCEECDTDTYSLKNPSYCAGCGCPVEREDLQEVKADE